MSNTSLHLWLINGNNGADLVIDNHTLKEIDSIIKKIFERKFEFINRLPQIDMILLRLLVQRDNSLLQKIPKICHSVLIKEQKLTANQLIKLLDEIAPGIHIPINPASALTKSDFQAALRKCLKQLITESRLDEVNKVINHFDQESINELLLPTNDESSLSEWILFQRRDDLKEFYATTLKNKLQEHATKIGLTTLSEEQYPEINQPGSLEKAFKSNLDRWVMSGSEGERRSEAAAKIKNILQDHSTSLSVSRLGLKTLPGCLVAANHLEILQAGGNELTFLPEGMSNLIELDVSVNNMGDFLAKVFHIRETVLDSDSDTDNDTDEGSLRTQNSSQTARGLTYLPMGMKNLKVLLASHNQLTSLPEGMINLTKAIVLNNQLTSLPPDMNNLEVLDVSHNQLTSLPPGMNRLVKLNAYKNELNTLPTGMSNLTKADVSDNRLTSLPDGMNSLLELNAYKNKLDTLPIGMKNLTKANASYNQLTSLPPGMNTLEVLNVGSNQLTSLPSGMNNLVELIVRHNQLTSLPPGMNKLKRVFVESNRLTHLPDMDNVVLLNALGNDLRTLPRSLRNLTFLDVSYNEFLNHLPTDIPPNAKLKTEGTKINRE